MSTPQDRRAKIQAAGNGSSGRANPIIVAGVVVVLIIALVVGGVIWSATRGTEGGDATPQGVTDGEPYNPYPDVELVEGAPTVDVYEDFRCPVCKTFEEAFGETIDELAADGQIRLNVHLKTVIDSITGGESSAIAGSSAMCAADQGAWSEYHSELFARQPAEETSDGFPESTYPEAAEAAGLSGEELEEFTTCTEENRYLEYVRSVEEASSEAGFTGTPALVVDGTEVSWGSFADGSGQPDPDALAEVLSSGEVPEDKVATE